MKSRSVSIVTPRPCGCGKSFNNPYWTHTIAGWRVQCSTCPASTTYYGTREAAIAAWNRFDEFEVERLQAAVGYCPPRLKRDAYRDALDAILRGDKDDQIRNPDLTPVVLS